ncbi:glycosyltransferase [Dolichospermum sp. ST_con]|nr:glycosyltransferase [Dolichospermum sp. ST_con]
MKLVYVTTLYTDYINGVYGKSPDLSLQNYEYQKTILDYDSFGWADFWSNSLKLLGYDVLDIRLNVSYLQFQWAKENDLSNIKRLSLDKIALEQIKKFKPDILWFDHYDPVFLKEIKQEVSTIKLVMGWSGSAIYKTDAWKNMNLMLSCAPEAVSYFNDNGLKAKHIHHAFDPRINDRLRDTNKTIDFCFIGQIIRSGDFHIYREKLLEEIVSFTNLHIFSSSGNYMRHGKLILEIRIALSELLEKIDEKNIKHINKYILKLVYKLKSKFSIPVNRNLIKFLKPAIYGLDMYKTLLESELTLNIHANSSPFYASNMRLFETTGVGTCLLTDWKQNITDLFEPDFEVVTYKSSSECIEKVKWLLANPLEARKIGKAGQNRTLSEHTFDRRSVQLDEIIQAALK